MSQDPLSKLLSKWRPENPDANISFADEVMIRIESEATHTYRKSLLEIVVEKWLPSPNFLLPVAAAIIVVVNFAYWRAADIQVKRLAAIHWHQSLSNPNAPVSLNGTIEMEKNYAP
jgi:hypothetical protein